MSKSVHEHLIEGWGPIDDPLDGFDPSKPFYILVLNHIMQNWAFLHTYAIGGFGEIRRRTEEIARIWADVEIQEQLSPEEQAESTKVQAELNGLLRLTDLDFLTGRTAKMAWNRIPIPCVTGGPRLMTTFARLSQQFGLTQNEHEDQVRMAQGHILILAYELTKQHNDQSPIWEFLRHCRNAAAHGGSFSFHPQEPRRPAHWRGIEINRQHQGSPLFISDTGSGLIDRGDPIRLLRDIEAAYPTIS